MTVRGRWDVSCFWAPMRTDNTCSPAAEERRSKWMQQTMERGANCQRRKSVACGRNKLRNNMQRAEGEWMVKRRVWTWEHYSPCGPSVWTLGFKTHLNTLTLASEEEYSKDCHWRHCSCCCCEFSPFRNSLPLQRQTHFKRLVWEPFLLKEKKKNSTQSVVSESFWRKFDESVLDEDFE